MAAPAAGRKNARVTFQAPTSAQNSEGVTVVTYADAHDRVPAEILTVTGSEQLSASQVVAVVSRTVVVWYSAALALVTPLWRIRNGSATYEVQSVENIENKSRELRFFCREVQAV